MVTLNKIYTKTGDGGETSLVGGLRVAKHSLRPEAFGEIDELNSILGLVRTNLSVDRNQDINKLLERVQNELFDLGADLCVPISEKNNQRLRVSNKNSLEECLFSSNNEGVKSCNLNMRCSGSAALDLAYVASGRLDGYFQNKINLWDVAAGVLMIKEAGGMVNDIDKYDINNIDIKASSAAINDKMLKNLDNF